MTAWAEEPDINPILQEVRDGVGVLTLNRPHKLNAWTPAMGRRYFEALDAMALDPQVRAILIAGAGRAFCAGADMSGLGNIAEGADAQADRTSRPYWLPISIGKPIVAAVQGPCIGFGFHLALCADVRFVAQDAKLATAYARRGLVGELGITWLLPRLIGHSAALDLLLSGRNVDAQEAHALGLANRVVPTEDLFQQAFGYCATLAATCSPASMRAIKRQVYLDLTRKLEEAYADSEALLAEILAGGVDFAEALAAFKEKRPPRFAPLPPELGVFDPSDPTLA
jgi:enoyl-CoA hydratase/carnithine racemase